jgi:arsenite methyltransferase
MDKKEIHTTVRENYADIARVGGSCCGPAQCDSSKQVGYTQAKLGRVPKGADLSLGCGNPIALVSLKEGDVVLDLGSGGGLDCLLASKQVGDTGQIIGVDMTLSLVKVHIGISMRLP